MQWLASFLVAAVAILHLYILVLEMFLWTKPQGRRAFGMTQEQAQQTKVLAAAGLITGLCMGAEGLAFQVFFLASVMVAGVYGAMTASKKILFIQTVPAGLALAA